MTTTATGSLPRQRTRTAAARHREPVSTHEMDAEPHEDWTGRCDARHCAGACLVWRMRATRQAQENRSVS